MAKTEVTFLICVVLLSAIVTLNRINAECCWEIILYQYRCHERDPISKAHICYDGTEIDGFFCGNGKCNTFGCRCMGGCRHNKNGFDANLAQELFKKKKCEKL